MLKHSVEVWVMNRDKVLLLHVPSSSDGSGFWQPITGGIKAGESSSAAAIRELFEETGIDAVASDLLEVASGLVYTMDDGLDIQKTLFLVVTSAQLIKISPHEHDAHQWVGTEEVRRRLYWPSNRETWTMVDEIRRNL